MDQKTVHADTSYIIKEQMGLLWTWWKGDELPAFTERTNIQVRETTDRRLINQLMLVSLDDCTKRLNEGHRVYIAYIHDRPAAYGWSASNNAAFGSPTVRFRVPEGNRYLYHFVTQIAYRGQSIYPRLLQAIIHYESSEHDRFWIIHHPRNIASRRGIAKAGFAPACQIHKLVQGNVILTSGEDEQRAQAAAEMLDLPLLAKQTTGNRLR